MNSMPPGSLSHRFSTSGPNQRPFRSRIPAEVGGLLLPTTFSETMGGTGDRQKPDLNSGSNQDINSKSRAFVERPAKFVLAVAHEVASRFSCLNGMDQGEFGSLLSRELTFDNVKALNTTAATTPAVNKQIVGSRLRHPHHPPGGHSSQLAY